MKRRHRQREISRVDRSAREGRLECDSGRREQWPLLICWVLKQSQDAVVFDARATPIGGVGGSYELVERPIQDKQVRGRPFVSTVPTQSTGKLNEPSKRVWLVDAVVDV